MTDFRRRTRLLWVPKTVAVPRGGQGPRHPARTLPLPPNETGCKVAGLHNNCSHSVASHSSLVSNYTTHSIMHYVIRNSCPQCGHPTGHPKLLQLETLLPLPGKLNNQYCLVFSVMIFSVDLSTFLPAILVFSNVDHVTRKMHSMLHHDVGHGCI